MLTTDSATSNLKDDTVESHAGSVVVDRSLSFAHTRLASLGCDGNIGEDSGPDLRSLDSLDLPADGGVSSLDLLGGQTSALLDTKSILSKLDIGSLGRASDWDWDLALVLLAVLHPLGLQTVKTALGLVHGSRQRTHCR